MDFTESAALYVENGWSKHKGRINMSNEIFANESYLNARNFLSHSYIVETFKSVRFPIIQ
jgi:hypothetical protein